MQITVILIHYPTGMGKEALAPPAQIVNLPSRFQEGGRFALDRMPLRDVIPLPSARRPDKGKMDVASHETNHLLIASYLGIPVVEVSVNPHWPVLGWTLIEGHINNQDYMTIAAGGAIHTPSGQAMGFGGDIFGIRQAANSAGKSAGAEIDAAKNRAHAILSEFPVPFRTKIAEIISLFGSASKEKLQSIFERAAFEHEWEMAGLDLEHHLHQSLFVFAKDESRIKKSEYEDPHIPQKGDYTLIIHGILGPSRRYFKDGEEVKECKTCGGIGEHTYNHTTGTEDGRNDGKLPEKDDASHSPQNHGSITVSKEDSPKPGGIVWKIL